MFTPYYSAQVCLVDFWLQAVTLCRHGCRLKKRCGRDLDDVSEGTLIRSPHGELYANKCWRERYVWNGCAMVAKSFQGGKKKSEGGWCE